jgi:hypothetical protein
MAKACDTMNTQRLAELVDTLVPEHRDTVALATMHEPVSKMVTQLKVVDARVSHQTS